MASFSIEDIGPYEATFYATGLTKGNTIRFFVRLTSNTSDTTDDYEKTATSTTASYTTYALAPSTSYTVNVHDGTAWIGAQTFTTPPVPKLSISSWTSDSVTVAFSSLKSGTTYRVIIADANYGSTYVDTTFTATASSATKTYSGLDPDTYYDVSIGVDGTEYGVSYEQFTTDAEIVWTVTSTSLGTLSDAYSVSYSFGTYVLRRFTVKFENSGTAKFYSTGSADTMGYLSRTTGYDEEKGEPTSPIASDDDSGSSNNFSFEYEVTAGTTYYLWVRLYDGAKTGTAYVCIDPPVITWSLSSSALGTLSDAYSASFAFGEYVLRRYSVKFERSGTAKFYTTGDVDTIGYLGTTSAYDEEAGEPTGYLATDDDSGATYNCSISYDVTAGTTYYFWVRLYDGAKTGTVTVCIEPPAFPRPSDWAWYSAIESGKPIILNGVAVAPTALEWNDFCSRINEFRVYAGLAECSFTTAVSGVTPISAAIVNEAWTAINAITGHGTLPDVAVAGGPMYASFFTGLRDALNAIP